MEPSLVHLRLMAERLPTGHEFADASPDKATALRCAVNCENEHSQISTVLSKFEPSSDGSRLFAEQSALLANQSACIPEIENRLDCKN